MFNALREAPIPNGSLKDQFQRSFATKIFRSGSALLMFCDAARNILGNSRVQAAVSTTHQVNTVFAGWHQSLVTRRCEAGFFSSSDCGRMGRGPKLPPQFGQMPLNTSFTHCLQKVHSNVQIMAIGDAGGRSQSQFSQLGRSSSIAARYPVRRDRRTIYQPAHATRRTPYWPCFLPTRRTSGRFLMHHQARLLVPAI